VIRESVSASAGGCQFSTGNFTDYEREHLVQDLRQRRAIGAEHLNRFHKSPPKISSEPFGNLGFARPLKPLHHPLFGKVSFPGDSKLSFRPHNQAVSKQQL
jgi:hypothetical protein